MPKWGPHITCRRALGRSHTKAIIERRAMPLQKAKQEPRGLHGCVDSPYQHPGCDSCYPKNNINKGMTPNMRKRDFPDTESQNTALKTAILHKWWNELPLLTGDVIAELLRSIQVTKVTRQTPSSKMARKVCDVVQWDVLNGICSDVPAIWPRRLVISGPNGYGSKKDTLQIGWKGTKDQTSYQSIWGPMVRKWAFICICTHIYIYTYIYIYTCMIYIYIYIYLYVYVYVCICLCMYIYIYMHIYIYIDMFVFIYIYDMSMFIYIHTHHDTHWFNGWEAATETLQHGASKRTSPEQLGSSTSGIAG